MMLPSHALVGLAVATPLLVLAPELAPTGLAAALLGSVLPDLDMYAGHRRTLHYPTVFTVLAVGFLAVAAMVPSTVTVAAAFLLTGAAVHCRMDRYGGGLELRPWEGNSDRAVYDHVRGRWRRPRRWIQYDGSPGDVLLSLLVGLPLLYVLGGPFGSIEGPFRSIEGPFGPVVGAFGPVEGPFVLVVVVALLVAVTYGALRRRLANLVPEVVDHVPDPVAVHVPDRYQ